MNLSLILQDKINEHQNVIKSSLVNFKKIIKPVHKLLLRTLKNKKNIFVCGNGGSASDALHFSGEFVSKFKSDKRKPINCICLNANISAITSIGNDFDYTKIFSRQLLAHGSKGDVIFLFSTSGKSQNIIDVAKVSKKMRIKSILFTGLDITPLHKYCDYIFQVRSKKTDLIQEAHIFYYHSICDLFENVK